MIIDYSYEVTGRLPFPLDMLRYDMAWPVRPDDVASIQASLARDGGSQTVRLNSTRRPTVGRWESFGWTVEIRE